MSQERAQWKPEKPWMHKDIDIPFRSETDRKRIERLFRRIEHLEQRCETNEQLGISKDFDRMELSALRYVLMELGKLRRVS